jgi:two-component system CheB/CheR fusion protein
MAKKASATNKKKAATPKAKAKAQAPKYKSPAESKTETPSIVGIGGSAGGLEAFTQFLQALPAKTGMAFVMVQHLEPKHASVLPALLARSTKMPVHEVREGMQVEPDHLYVIPANADMSLLDGLLHIVGRKAPAGHHLPIDFFLRSLAEKQGSRAIGVILSGTASDGSEGIRAIKGEGGITFAQDPDSAKFDGMPRSAIATGCVDFVFPPDRIAKELVRIVRHPLFLAMMPDAIPPVPAHDGEWAQLFRLLRSATGVDFTLYKKSTIKRRVSRRMAVTKAETLSDFLKLLERNRMELDALFEELVILVTDFFREPEVFQALQKKIFPQLVKDKPAEEPIRIWVAGCSTGQEAYSLAIRLLEFLGERAHGRPIQIFATDLSENGIERARIGLYSPDQVKSVPKPILHRFFKRVSGGYQVNENIREMCIFARHDLIRDAPFSKIDLLSCRNVLIYFEAALQKRVMSSFHYALRPNGVLLLGKSESLGGFADLFTPTDRKLKFFRKNTGAHVPFSIAQPAYEYLFPGRPLKEPLPAIDLEKEADQVVWERSAFAGLVVNDDLQILHFRGDTSPYLRPVPGKATLQLMRILREELVLEVRSALQKARRSGRITRAQAVQLELSGQKRSVNVEVRPLVHGVPGKSYLVLFEQAAAAAPADAQVAQGAARKQRDSQEVGRLRGELARTREYVQAIIRDQETTNEELKTSNEEALSSMEELQSTNEELETAKEELQSSNEELITLNEQLQNRNSELALLSSDLGNVLGGVDIPIVILGGDRRIRRFTPPAEKLLGLITGDVGRPLRKLRIGVHLPELDDLISVVMEQGKEAVRDVQTDSGRWYLLRILPFRNREGKIEGVLLAFVDIHDVKQHQEELRKDRNFISAILDAAQDLLVAVLDSGGRFVHFNQACQQRTGYSLDEVRGRHPWDFMLLPEDVESAKAGFQSLSAGPPAQRERHWIAKDGRRLLIRWSTSVVMSDGAVESVIAAGVDVTERQEATLRAESSEAAIRALMETSEQAIVASNKKGRLVIANSGAEKMFGYSREMLIGQPMEILIPEQLRERHAAHLAEWFAHPRSRPLGGGLELIGRRRDGSQFPVDIGLSYADGEEALAVAVISDITERKRQEQERAEWLAKERAFASEKKLLETETELARAGRVLAVGELASTIAHEVNQPLAGVLTNAEAGLRWLAASQPNVDEARRSLQLIARDANLAAQVIRRIREFLKHEKQEKALVDLKEVVQEVISLLGPELEKNQIEVRMDLAADLPPVPADRIQLQQVLLNLIMNSRDAMAGVTGGMRELALVARRADHGILVSVHDSGTGVDPQDLGRMFDPFYSTKSDGMGLGLSISRTIIESLGGRIWAEPNDGQPGLAVQFHLPSQP